MATLTINAPKTSQRPRRIQPRSQDLDSHSIAGMISLDDVTVCMTAFRRPKKVVAQIESIRKFYPDLKIVVGDNGDEYPDLSFDSHTELFPLAFDCGLAAARNATIAAARTKYVLIVDDDNIWTEATQVERLIDILESNPHIGIVGTWQHDTRYDDVTEWQLNFESQGDSLLSRVSREPITFTPNGTPFRKCDAVLNFAMARHKVFGDCPWNNRLKLAEHWEFYYRLKQQGKWSVAYCPWVGSIHDALPRQDRYIDFRSRSEVYEKIARDQHGINQRFKLESIRPEKDHQEARPNLVILTPGHTGSSVVAAILGMLGWNFAGDLDEFHESVSLRTSIQRGNVAAEYFKNLQQPWAIKDPRFCETILQWLPELEKSEPALLYLTRKTEEIRASYARRGEDPDCADERIKRCEQIFSVWPWKRMSIDFSNVNSAAGLFDQSRIGCGFKGFDATESEVD